MPVVGGVGEEGAVCGTDCAFGVWRFSQLTNKYAKDAVEGDVPVLKENLAVVVMKSVALSGSAANSQVPEMQRTRRPKTPAMTALTCWGCILKFGLKRLEL